jgi:hypothetical protein
MTSGPTLNQLLVVRFPCGLRRLGLCQPGWDVGGPSFQVRVGPRCEHLADALIKFVPGFSKMSHRRLIPALRGLLAPVLQASPR